MRDTFAAHHSLARFGLDNDNEVFHAGDFAGSISGNLRVRPRPDTH
jgi:hypothetical protein